MRTEAAAPGAAIRSRRSQPARPVHVTSRRAEQSLVSELALVWRPHRPVARDANRSIGARIEERARHTLAAGPSPRLAVRPRKGGTT